MPFAIKFKVGFFKTKIYELDVQKGQIVLKPQEGNGENCVIKHEEIESVSFISKDTKNVEIEIVTRNDIYLGSVIPGVDIGELEKIMAKELGPKLALCKSTFC